jgi:hypothetical protein
MEVAVMIFDPSVAVAIVVKREFAGLTKFESTELFYLIAEGINAHALDSVFQSGIGADVAITKVALNSDDSFTH